VCINHLKHFILDLTIAVSEFFEGENTGVYDSHNEFKSDLFIVDVGFGIGIILIDQEFNKLIEDLSFLCYYDEVHYYHNQLLIRLFLLFLL
jgi:hypothetical protein